MGTIDHTLNLRIFYSLQESILLFANTFIWEQTYDFSIIKGAVWRSPWFVLALKESHEQGSFLVKLGPIDQATQKCRSQWSQCKHWSWDGKGLMFLPPIPSAALQSGGKYGPDPQYFYFLLCTLLQLSSRVNGNLYNPCQNS